MTESLVEERVAAVPQPQDDLLVHRNRALLAAVTLLATGVALAYGWRGLQGWMPGWLIAGAFLLVALLHLHAWTDARKPLLVADTRGVRVRLGKSWSGHAWGELAEVKVQGRRHLLTDGTLLVRPRTGAAYKVPLGAASQDIGRALTSLADGRATVVAPEQARAFDNEVRPAPPAVVLAGDSPQPGEAATHQPRGASPARAVTRGPRWLSRSRSVPGSPLSAPPAQASNDVADDPAIAEPSTNPAGAQPVEDGEQGSPDAAAASLPAQRRRAVRADVRRGASPADAQPTGAVESEVRGTESRVGLVIEHVPSPTSAEVAPYAVPLTSQEVTQTSPPAAPVIGPELVLARNQLRVSVDQLADRTRIRPHVIEAMEVDDFAPCGGDFYARGHLRRVASVLGLDPDPIVELYDARYSSEPIAASTVFSAELASGPGAAVRGTRGGPNWTALLGVVVALMVLWGVARVVTASEPAPDAAAAPRAQASSAPEPDPDRFAGVGVGPRVVSLSVSADTVVRLQDGSGDTIWIGPMQAGESRRWSVTGEVTVRARNASAVTAQLGTDDPVGIGQEDAPGEITLGES